MNEILIQSGVLLIVVAIFMLYTEWRIRNYSTTIIKKIDAVMAKLIGIRK
jgi:hypothetical membrane protein